MTKYADVLNNYKTLNKTAVKNAAVFFGADWLSEIPVAELARDKEIAVAVYNRSIKGLVLDDIDQVLEDCVCALNPEKVFVNIGENDIKSINFDMNEFSEKYEWLLYAIHSKCNCKIYVLSIVGSRENDVNEVLKSISEKYACEYIDVCSCRKSVLDFFKKVRFFLRTHPITFYEAFRI